MRFLKLVHINVSTGLLILFTFANCTDLKEDTENTKTERQKLDYFLALADSVRQNANVPGAGFAIVNNGQILYTGGLGLSDIKAQTPVDENTLFSIGSNTKAFTGTLAAKLVEEGKMTWHTPLKNYIPELQLKEEYVERNVNLIDALNHTTGLGRHDTIWKYKKFPRNEILEKVKELDFATGFRSSFSYNNLMYVIAGIAMERAGNGSWEGLVQEKLLAPLEMTNSYLTQEQFEASPNRAIGYKQDGETPETIVYLNHIAPAGSISSTAKDISHWVAMLVNKGEHNGKKILKESEYTFMMTAHDDIGFRPPNQYWFYNAGIGGFTEEGKRNLGHSGSIDGQNSFMVLRPDDGFAIFIMTNKISGYKELMAKYAQNIFVHDNYERDHQTEKQLKDLAGFGKFSNTLKNKDILSARQMFTSLNAANLEGAMDQLGYELMGMGEFEKAEFVFVQNTIDHPKSSNVFDSLGEYYFNIQDYDRALKNYKKAYSLDERNSNAAMMMGKIKTTRP